MAFTASTIFEIRLAGSDTACSGLFDPGVSGMATDGAATSANTASPVFTSASYTFVAGDVNAWLFVKSGTGWLAGWYQIASVSAGAATLSAAIGAAVLANTHSFQPLSVSTAAGCATTASPTAATWTIDYSQQSSAQITFTDLAIDATTNTKFTSTNNPVGKNFVGNAINVTSGTGFTVQRVVVVSTSGTVATCDKSLGTLSSTAGHGNLGGALATPGQAGALYVGGGDIFTGAGTINMTSGTQNVSGGRLLIASGNSGATANWGRIRGYNTIRMDSGTRPTWKATVSIGSTMVLIGGTEVSVENLIVDGNAQASTNGVTLNANETRAVNVLVKNCVNGMQVGQSSAQAQAIFCEATGCSGNGFTGVGFGSMLVGCEAHANTGPGFGVQNNILMHCLSYANTGTSSDGFQMGSAAMMMNCTSYGNGRHGFFCSSSNGMDGLLQNCVATGNGTSVSGGWGFQADGYEDGTYLLNCFGYNNTSGNYNTSNLSKVDNFVALSGDPYVAAASGNFALNSTSGAGALVRGGGTPGAFPAGTTTGYLDGGAAQHSDASVSTPAVTRGFAYCG